MRDSCKTSYGKCGKRTDLLRLRRRRRRRVRSRRAGVPVNDLPAIGAFLEHGGAYAVALPRSCFRLAAHGELECRPRRRAADAGLDITQLISKVVDVCQLRL